MGPNCTMPTLLLLLISEKPWFPCRKCYCCFEFRYICAEKCPILAKIWTTHCFHVEINDVVVLFGLISAGQMMMLLFI